MNLAARLYQPTEVRSRSRSRTPENEKMHSYQPFDYDAAVKVIMEKKLQRQKELAEQYASPEGQLHMQRRVGFSKRRFQWKESDAAGNEFQSPSPRVTKSDPQAGHRHLMFPVSIPVTTTQSTVHKAVTQCSKNDPLWETKSAEQKAKALLQRKLL